MVQGVIAQARVIQGANLVDRHGAIKGATNAHRQHLEAYVEVMRQGARMGFVHIYHNLN